LIVNNADNTGRFFPVSIVKNWVSTTNKSVATKACNWHYIGSFLLGAKKSLNNYGLINLQISSSHTTKPFSSWDEFLRDDDVSIFNPSLSKNRLSELSSSAIYFTLMRFVLFHRGGIPVEKLPTSYTTHVEPFRKKWKEDAVNFSFTDECCAEIVKGIHSY
jgi:hypothetical protein